MKRIIRLTDLSLVSAFCDSMRTRYAFDCVELRFYRGGGYAVFATDGKVGGLIRGCVRARECDTSAFPAGSSITPENPGASRGLVGRDELKNVLRHKPVFLGQSLIQANLVLVQLTQRRATFQYALPDGATFHLATREGTLPKVAHIERLARAKRSDRSFGVDPGLMKKLMSGFASRMDSTDSALEIRVPNRRRVESAIKFAWRSPDGSRFRAVVMPRTRS